MKSIRSLSPVLLALLVGCGGGGSSDVDASGDEGVPPPIVSGAILGTRSVPGYQLEVTTNVPPLAGSSRRVILRVTPDDDAPALHYIAAAITDTAEQTMPMLTPGTAVTGVANSWAWQMTLPEDLNGKRVVVRLQDPHGNVSFSGFSDFVLTP